MYSFFRFSKKWYWQLSWIIAGCVSVAIILLGVGVKAYQIRLKKQAFIVLKNHHVSVNTVESNRETTDQFIKKYVIRDNTKRSNVGYQPRPAWKKKFHSLTGNGKYDVVSCSFPRKFPDELIDEVVKFSKIHSLYFWNSDLSDAQLIRLKKLRHVNHLDLFNSSVTDTGMAVLTHFPELTHLNLSQTRVTDASIPYILQLKKLEKLSIAKTLISPQGVVQLTQMSQLKDLAFSFPSEYGNNITNNVRNTFHQKLPSCNLSSGGRKRPAWMDEHFKKTTIHYPENERSVK